jgi:Dyp-type peroxidase family
MLTTIPAREAPASSPLKGPSDLTKSRETKNEPILKVDNIQGNVLAGFMKDHQAFLFLTIVEPEVDSFRRWLASVVPFIATTGEVLSFNRLFKSLRSRRGESKAVKATWINIAFSHEGLRKLGQIDPQHDFLDESFKAGLSARSESLGDPPVPGVEGNPSTWVVGGEQNEADVILIVASDDRDDLYEEVARIENGIFSPPPMTTGQPDRSGVHLIYKQYAHNLPGAMAGHEHFGFLDGISQPGVRGLVNAPGDPPSFLTPSQNPNDPDGQGKPGQDLLWPGEFVFGYPGQDPKKDIGEPGDTSVAGPSWAEDGSFLVFRRLRQDVFGFHQFLNQSGAGASVDPDLIGSRLVGRWQSGAPVLRAPNGDNQALGDNDCANNNFEFFGPSDTPPPDMKNRLADTCEAPGKFLPSPGDRNGAVCPFVGHVRKAYPRNDITPAGAGTSADPETQSKASESDTQTHRMLRRGIPFGEVSRSTPRAPFEDQVDRGLIFVSYQTSIEDQFEFVTQNWVNNPNFAASGTGEDLIIGLKNTGPRVATINVGTNGASSPLTLSAPKHWVLPTGGGYFFSPSIKALGQFAGQGGAPAQGTVPTPPAGP